MDTKLATTKKYVKIKGDKAIWSNSWDAAGKEIVWDMVHYDVQLIGGIGLTKEKLQKCKRVKEKHYCNITRFLNALTGNGVHLVTVNDYLAKRDCTWMAPIFEFHGLTIDCIDRYKPHSKRGKMLI